MITLFGPLGKAISSGWVLWRPLALGLLIGLSGCTGWNLRGDGFGDDGLSAAARHGRPEKRDGDFWSYSEKGRQIERDLEPQK
jgi:hypothetical protein